jgi:hypothetical protein
MRIAVGEPALRQQGARFLQGRDHGRVGVALLAVGPEHALAGEQRHMGVEGAVLAHGLRHLDAVGHAELPVVGAVAGRDMDEARALVRGDETAGEERHFEVVALTSQRVGADRAGQRSTLAGPCDLAVGDAQVLLEGRAQLRGDQQLLTDPHRCAVRHRRHGEQQVVHLLAEGHRTVARNGPGRGRPDHRRGAGELLQRRAQDRKAHVDRVGDMVVILDLGLGERRLLHDRPQHRLGALEQAAIHQELADLAQDLRLGGVGHGQVRIVPVALDAEAAELLALHVDPVFGELPAFPPELDDRDGVLVLAGGAVLLLDLPFDRQAVAVPPRDVVGVLAQHLLRPIDHVFQDLVERRADVNVGIGVRRAVMEDELRPPLRFRAQPLEQRHLLPARQDLGLALRQVGPHREVGLRQEDGRFVVHAHVVRCVRSQPRDGRRGPRACS